MSSLTDDLKRRVEAAEQDGDAPIVFGSPLIGEEEIAEVVDTLRSGWLGTGPKTSAFEALFASRVGCEYAVATNSGTAALHLALSASGIEPGDEVITTPLTFVATANVIEHCGATPVFADVDPDSGNLDPANVECVITDRTRAVLPVHYAGALADVPALRRRLPGVSIVADAAHAVEATFENGESSAGGGANATAYSFYVTKNLVTGEGGMLATNDQELAANARIRSLHGLDNDAWRRYSSGHYGEYELRYAGFKYNMTDIQASLGLHQLRRIEENLERRRALWGIYNEGLADIPGLAIPPAAREPGAEHALHLYTVWLDWDELGLMRKEFVEALRDAGIGTGWHFKAVHLHEFYRLKYGYCAGDFPRAEHIAERTISLPLSPKLSERDVLRVVAVVRDTILSRSGTAVAR